MKAITRAVLDIETMKWIQIESCEYTGPVDLCCGRKDSVMSEGQREFMTELDVSLAEAFSGDAVDTHCANRIAAIPINGALLTALRISPNTDFNTEK